jgi:pimeloyl-ACP methyl ester carboxylesterase
LLQNIIGSELEIIESSGHLPSVENPDSFNRALNDFLKKHFLSDSID